MATARPWGLQTVAEDSRSRRGRPREREGRGQRRGGGAERERGNDTRRSTGRSGRQNAATRRNMRREERVTVPAPVKEQQPDGMSHGGSERACQGRCWTLKQKQVDKNKSGCWKAPPGSTPWARMPTLETVTIRAPLASGGGKCSPQ